LSRQSVMDFLTDARLPPDLHADYDGVPATRWDSVSREAGIVAGADQWTQRLAVLQGELLGEDEGDDQPAWVKQRAADARELARFIAELHGQLQAHPARAPWAE